MLNILVVFQTLDYRFRATTKDHLYCFRNYSGHRCFYLNVARSGEPYYEEIPEVIKRIKFDLVIFHVDLLGFLWPPYTLDFFIAQAGALKSIDAVKVALMQDEYYNTILLNKFINEFDINYVFSLAPESELKKIYTDVNFEKVKFFRNLPGYLDTKTLSRIKKLEKKITERSIDIGYRANGIRHWLGRHGYLKIQIADEFSRRGSESQLVMDISTRAEDTFLGDDWYKFLLQCKYTISVEGGASIQDRDGSIRERTENYLHLHPNADFEETEKNCFPGVDGSFKYMAISPKHLEACATRTCQILIEGDYNGILKPGIHYMELKRDFSNIDEILTELGNEEKRNRIVERAYKDIVESGHYGYQNFVNFVLKETAPRKGNWSLITAFDLYSWGMYMWFRIFEFYQRVHLKVEERELKRETEKLERMRKKEIAEYERERKKVELYYKYAAFKRKAVEYFWKMVTWFIGVGPDHLVKRYDEGNELTPIDRYWSSYTVYAPQFYASYESALNLKWRFDIHPLFKELSGLYGTHDGETILDFGCGPGNDLTGFAIFTNASKIIGIDISEKSLQLASKRLSLHKVPLNRVELLQVSDGSSKIPLPSASVDFINCQGVLMHTRDPETILNEFYRILKPGGSACLMVYNKNSIWYNLYTPYERVIIGGEFEGLNSEEAFSKTTDGLDCPMSRCYPPDQFVNMCQAAGFHCHFAGGYFTQTEINSMDRYLSEALNNKRLGDSYRRFLIALEFDEKGFPKFNGYYAGVSGIYKLYKPK